MPRFTFNEPWPINPRVLHQQLETAGFTGVGLHCYCGPGYFEVLLGQDEPAAVAAIVAAHNYIPDLPLQISPALNRIRLKLLAVKDLLQEATTLTHYKEVISGLGKCVYQLVYLLSLLDGGQSPSETEYQSGEVDLPTDIV